MKAAIIAVGNELLTPSRVDTNSLYITNRLNELGIEVHAKAVVGDRVDDLVSVLRLTLASAELVIVTGGLGPTDDDKTRLAVSTVLDAPLELDEGIVARIRHRFEARGLRMPAINRRQGEVPRGATVLENPNGTAPGLCVEQGSRLLLVLPGPPSEMQPMLDRFLSERLAARAGNNRVYRRVLRTTGRPESDIEERAYPIYSRFADLNTTILASPGQVELHLSARAPTEQAAIALLDQVTQELQEVLGVDLFSVRGALLEEVVGALLRAGRLRIAVAESCTGGLIASRLTDVPGSSDYFQEGIVAYSNRSKIEQLRIPAEVLERHGAVSEQVASAMAAAIRTRASVDIGVGVTGIAGPGGGSEEKPVGTVAIAVEGGQISRVRLLRFFGGRTTVKFQAAQAALDMVRRLLIKHEGLGPNLRTLEPY